MTRAFRQATAHLLFGTPPPPPAPLHQKHSLLRNLLQGPTRLVLRQQRYVSGRCGTNRYSQPDNSNNQYLRLFSVLPACSYERDYSSFRSSRRRKCGASYPVHCSSRHGQSAAGIDEQSAAAWYSERFGTYTFEAPLTRALACGRTLTFHFSTHSLICSRLFLVGPRPTICRLR